MDGTHAAGRAVGAGSRTRRGQLGQSFAPPVNPLPSSAKQHRGRPGRYELAQRDMQITPPFQDQCSVNSQYVPP